MSEALAKQRGFFVLGAGGHAKVLVDVLLSQNIQVRSLIAPACDPHSLTLRELPIMSDDLLKSLDARDMLLINGVGSLPGTSTRQDLFEKYAAIGFRFAQVISHTAWVSSSVDLGAGVQILHGAIVQCEAEVGSNTIINTRAVVEHDSKIGSHCHVAPSATLCGGVVIGDRTHVGTGAIVIQGVTVGSNSVIGAGAVVTKDVPDNTVIYPAKGFSKSRD